MNWRQDGKYRLVSGEWAILKYMIRDVAKYLLLRRQEEHGYFDTADEAKDCANGKK